MAHTNINVQEHEEEYRQMGRVAGTVNSNLKWAGV